VPSKPPLHSSTVPEPSASAPTARELNRVDLDAVVVDPARKQEFVTPMFQHIAPRYDAFTRLFSFGMDARWKRVLLGWVAESDRAAPDALDVACGTGDLALALARTSRSVVGLDAADAMIAQARARAAREGPGVDFQVADLTRTPFADETFDVITAGYAFRNVPNLAAALRETVRLLRPGGALYVLDFYRPANPLWRALFLRYLSVAGSLVGWWWHRSPAIYRYIAVSIAHYVTGEEFAGALSSAGLEPRRVRAFLGGGIMLHEARRPAR
jgi:demethylmenaquinone methyltransferase/2-methoxy-6-polyprenyl-1,4-benzoquinol methylase